MANPFSKGWKYMMASFDKSIDDNADPKVQIHQAAEAARKQHQEIQRQAAAVIGNRNQLEMQLGRLTKEREKLTTNTRAALQQADAARSAGDEAKAVNFEQTAEVFASQLVSVETELEQTTQMHEQAVRAADEAQKQAKQSQMQYEQMKGQIRELEAQADQAKMQETASETLSRMKGVSNDPNTPTLDSVREKIESRYANALGAQELAADSHAGRMAEIEASGVDMKADARLAEIRAQMANENNALESGSSSDKPAGELNAAPEADAAVADYAGAADATNDAENVDDADAVGAPQTSNATETAVDEQYEEVDAEYADQDQAGAAGTADEDK
ncbi:MULTISPECIES: PspA/IM30 family protein [unclassified Corynebacterium]|uniref:PspA/IM30 family protein n=1 Tax=unclassified Corynebacterium TaxID=2624378 RepID=UPI0030B338D6